MYQFLFQAVNGTIDFGSEFNRARFKDCLKKNNGRQFRIELIKKGRSLTQNRFYWAYLEIIERETGNNADYLHEYFRRKLLPPKHIKVLGKEIMIPASTIELSKDAMMNYMDKISAESGVAIPNPEEYKKYINSAPMINE